MKSVDELYERKRSGGLIDINLNVDWSAFAGLTYDELLEEYLSFEASRVVNSTPLDFGDLSWRGPTLTNAT